MRGLRLKALVLASIQSLTLSEAAALSKTTALSKTATLSKSTALSKSALTCRSKRLGASRQLSGSKSAHVAGLRARINRSNQQAAAIGHRQINEEPVNVMILVEKHVDALVFLVCARNP